MPFQSTLPLRRLRAFTLVELLVVIVIIALLAAVSLVAYRSVMLRANRGAASGTMRSIGQTIEVYLSNHNGVYPGSEEGPPYLAEVQTASVTDPQQLSYYLAEEIWAGSLSEEERKKQKYLREYASKIALPYLDKTGGDMRDLYFLYHIDTDLTKPEPGPDSIDTTNSVWGRKAGRISFDKSQIPMLSDTYLSAKWSDYKDQDPQTFWGDSFLVMYYDGHIESVKASKFAWVKVIPVGGE